MRMKFRFHLIPFIAAAGAAAIGIALGEWQTRRAVEKETMETRMVAREAAQPVSLQFAPRSVDEVEYRRATLKGEFVDRWTVYLDNRPYKSMPGFYVLTPFRLAGSDMYVLVARGWARRDLADRTKLPPALAPVGAVEIQGIVRRSPGRLLQLGEAPPLRPGSIVQNVGIPEFAQAAGMPMLPFMIEQTSDTRDGLVRDWPRPSTGAERHRGYAFQWYALAATALIFFVVTGFRRGNDQTG